MSTTDRVSQEVWSYKYSCEAIQEKLEETFPSEKETGFDVKVGVFPIIWAGSKLISTFRKRTASSSGPRLRLVLRRYCGTQDMVETKSLTKFRLNCSRKIAGNCICKSSNSFS